MKSVSCGNRPQKHVAFECCSSALPEQCLLDIKFYSVFMCLCFFPECFMSFSHFCVYTCFYNVLH